jgi:hypothetical protein
VSAGSVAVVSLDLHKQFSMAVAMGPDGGILDDRRAYHADPGEMERFFQVFGEGV